MNNDVTLIIDKDFLGALCVLAGCGAIVVADTVRMLLIELFRWVKR